jgi:hypothetical protein
MRGTAKNGNQAAVAKSLPSTLAHFKSVASAIFATSALRALEFKHVSGMAKTNFGDEKL